ncbi:MAG: thioesterase [Niameybacter sp.]|uniref:acyl-[acyl-carrier-protein] thioesterase n=1 Tax=Niameybacter sp. TaxID=2033640 RepID=UPI002FC7C679
MIAKYSKVFKVNFRDVDFKYNISMNALVDFMQEISGEHALELGIDFTTDEDQQMYWIVSRAKMHLDRYPRWQDNIRIETYPIGIDKLFCVRRFDIFDEEDQLMGYMIGYYILMDYHTHRPLRVQKMEGIIKTLNWPYEGEALPKLKEPQEVVKEELRKVHSGEIDINGHMNNAHYVRWATDMIDCKEYNVKCIESIQTNYTTSLVEGEEIQIIRGLDEEGNTLIQGMSLDQKTIYWTSKIVLKDL